VISLLRVTDTLHVFLFPNYLALVDLSIKAMVDFEISATQWNNLDTNIWRMTDSDKENVHSTNSFQLQSSGSIQSMNPRMINEKQDVVAGSSSAPASPSNHQRPDADVVRRVMSLLGTMKPTPLVIVSPTSEQNLESGLLEIPYKDPDDDSDLVMHTSPRLQTLKTNLEFAPPEDKPLKTACKPTNKNQTDREVASGRTMLENTFMPIHMLASDYFTLRSPKLPRPSKRPSSTEIARSITSSLNKQSIAPQTASGIAQGLDPRILPRQFGSLHSTPTRNITPPSSPSLTTSKQSSKASKLASSKLAPSFHLRMPS
jgi:hypothetical protein